MKLFRFCLAFLLAFFAQTCLWAQLSPGELSQPHAQLEGLRNCTKCHEIGERVVDRKCLDCHHEIQSRVASGKGFHASQEARAQACAQCHSDHHGRQFNMVRLDQNAFDHAKTGYELTGKHRTIDCRQCHKADFVDDVELKKREKTFLGARNDCAGCHADPHQNTLGKKCGECHATDGFAPARKFDHAKTDFALFGKHRDVGCIECHPKEARSGGGGEQFQKFSGVAFANCTACHDDPHRGKIGADCKACHVEQGFEVFKGMGKFNHARTDFPLVGKHKTVNCAECHNYKGVAAAEVFQDRKGVTTSQCATCHKDVHEGKFGADCKACHTEESFKIKGVPENFDHARTDFPLAGKHAAVNCKECHKENFIQPLAFNACAVCHDDDYHENQFADAGKSPPDCAKCHVADGFEVAIFSVAQHAESRFPLDGAHIATPCFACHQRENEAKWQFRNIGLRCVDCHADVHAGVLSEQFYQTENAPRPAAKACESCHATGAWAETRFDHARTKFRLEGAHVEQTCAACHRKTGENPPLRFAGISMECVACHDNVHGRQFEKNGRTDCLACHAFADWSAPKFRHEQAAFKLDGKHAKAACKDCHKRVAMDDGVARVQYKFPSFECVVCHR